VALACVKLPPCLKVKSDKNPSDVDVNSHSEYAQRKVSSPRPAAWVSAISSCDTSRDGAVVPSSFLQPRKNKGNKKIIKIDLFIVIGLYIYNKLIMMFHIQFNFFQFFQFMDRSLDSIRYRHFRECLEIQ